MDAAQLNNIGRAQLRFFRMLCDCRSLHCNNISLLFVRYMKTLSTQAPVKYSWMPDHTPNASGSSAGAATMLGSNNAYVPYSTTKPKVESWVPPTN